MSSSWQICGWGRNVAMGYLNKEAETKEVMTEDNWLKLGDLGYTDDDGFVSVLGKDCNFITLKTGEVISPFRVSINYQYSVRKYRNFLPLRFYAQNCKKSK